MFPPSLIHWPELKLLMTTSTPSPPMTSSPLPQITQRPSLPKVTLQLGTRAGLRLKSRFQLRASFRGSSKSKARRLHEKAACSQRLAKIPTRGGRIHSGLRVPPSPQVTSSPPGPTRTTPGSGPRPLLRSWHTSHAAQVGSRPGPSPGSNSKHPRGGRAGPPGLLPGREHAPSAPGPCPAAGPSPGREVPPRRGRRW